MKRKLTGYVIVEPRNVGVGRVKAVPFFRYEVRPPPAPRDEIPLTRYKCVNGHDRCGQMYAGPDCPYCERST